MTDEQFCKCEKANPHPDSKGDLRCMNPKCLLRYKHPPPAEGPKDWQQRVITEREALVVKMKMLHAIRGTKVWNNLDVIDQMLLDQQAEAMITYANVLEERIARFT
jgi:hypothetical protein